MDCDWMLDSSPNTRSRKKRELEEEQAGRVGWKCDEALRRYVLQQAEHAHLEPPTPTQKPRPISSRLASSPSDPSSSSSSSSRPASSRPRKRPCRQRTSLPSLPSASTDSASSSVSSAEKLDALLARFALGHAGEESQTSPLRLMNPNITAPSPLRHTLSSVSIESNKASMTSLASTSTTRSSLHFDRSGSSLSRHTTLDVASPGKPLTVANVARLPVSPTKQGAPRIGLRSSQSVSTARKGDVGNPTTAPATTATGNRLNRQFKPPSLATRPQIAQPIRSSPRRHPPPTATAPHVRPRQPIRTPMKEEQVPRLSPLKRGKEPSSDGPTTGDESFDSFDGMFAEGGADIEEILRKVDGSQ